MFMTNMLLWWTQARSYGGEAPLESFLPPLEKCVGHSLKLLDIGQLILAPLGKLFAAPGASSWLMAWVDIRQCPATTRN